MTTVTVTRNKANAWNWAALDPEFDRVVVERARTCFPEGYDVVDDAPQTLEEINQLLNSGARMKVWSGASQFTIYGAPEVNFAFRAWHDWTHWKGQFPFNVTGEAATANAQVNELRTVYGDSENTRRWACLIYTEVVGQVLYADINNGTFPGNQRLFVKELSSVLMVEEPLLPAVSEKGS